MHWFTSPYLICQFQNVKISSTLYQLNNSKNYVEASFFRRNKDSATESAVVEYLSEISSHPTIYTKFPIAYSLIFPLSKPCFVNQIFFSNIYFLNSIQKLHLWVEFKFIYLSPSRISFIGNLSEFELLAIAADYDGYKDKERYKIILYYILL